MVADNVPLPYQFLKVLGTQQYRTIIYDFFQVPLLTQTLQLPAPEQPQQRQQ